MSHNTQVINTIEPDALSNYTAVTSRPFILIGRGESDVYTNSGGSLSAGSNTYFYDTAPVNSIVGASLSGANDWYYAITLPVGSYFIRAFFSALFSATGSMRTGLHNGSVYVGSQAFIGGSTLSTYDGGGFASTTITITSPTTFSLKIVSSSNLSSVSAQGDVPAEESWMMVEKVL